MNRIVIPSPDQTKCVYLDYKGDARFGPAFFFGSSSGFLWPLGNTVIGEDVHWSADSRYVLTLAFRSTDTSKAPDVELIAIDTTDNSVITVDRNRLGLIYPSGFNDAGEYEYRYVESGVSSLRRWLLPQS